MGDSQPQPHTNIFSVRIVSIDYYMAPPIADLDISYSSFQGEKVNEVPVIRIYGSTPAGQKTCLHVHRVLPYLYVPCSDILLQTQEEGDAYTRTLSHAIEKALKLKGTGGSKRQHVHGCSLVRARQFYGYHSSEELFVKIYLYYPHEIARIANILQGGAVLDKSFQPHESHIPYLLQFLVDYNLYGMGHLHLAKVKFRHPLPETFIPRVAWYNGQHKEKPTCISVNFQADSGDDASLGLPVWISSKIPSGWMWPYPTEVDTSFDQDIHLIKRQSTCELEGDATVDDILNQQFKLYSSLSQTRSEVKMVQSLIPIWEEEYERTGLHETVISPDPRKPLPEITLRVLSHGFEFESTFMDLCRKAENLSSSQVAPVEEAEKFVHSIKPLAEVGNLVGFGENGSTDNSHKESLKCTKDRNINGLLISQRFLHKESNHDEGNEIHTKERNILLDQLPVDDEILSCEMIRTSDSKIVDEEAMGLLRWLASSQVAEDLNTEDELLHESILSTFLPTTSMDKILEKANLEYESESQQECQDILDSVDNVIEDLDDLDQNHLPQASLKNIIPQMDGSYDDHFTIVRTETNVELERSSPDEVVEDTDIGLGGECKRNKPVWGSLPFSTLPKAQTDVELPRFSFADTSSEEIKDGTDNFPFSGKKAENCSDASVANANANITHLQEGNTLTGCSLRDLMRRKRFYQVEPSEYGACSVQKMPSGKGQEEEKQKGRIFLGSKQLEFQQLQNDKKAMARSNQKAEVFDRNSCVRTCLSKSLGGRLEQCNSCGSSCLTNSVKRGKFCEGSCSEKNDNEAIVDMESVPEMHTGNFENINVVAEATVLQREDLGSGGKDIQTCLYQSEKGSKGHGEYIEMTFSMKPPVIDWTDWIYKYTPLTSPVHNNAFLRDKDACEEALACESSLTEFKRECEDEFILFFEDKCQEDGKIDKYYKNKELNFQQEIVYGVPTHCQNDGSFLYLLTPVYAPPSVDCVSKWLLNEAKGVSETSPKSKNYLDIFNVKDKFQDPQSVSSSGLITLQGSQSDACCETLPQSFSLSHTKPILDLLNQGSSRKQVNLCHPGVTTEFHSETNIKEKECPESWLDISQISGPDRSKLTPLSQIGFRDPASVGSGQQLTLLSIEVQAESRGDLRPDPRFDAINCIALVAQEDSSHNLDIFLLMRCDDGKSCLRNLDGISGCKVVVVSEEKPMFDHFVQIICSLDPDILMGWEIQGGSLGFLAERAAHLGVTLLNSISRTPTSETKSVVKDSVHTEGEIPGSTPPDALATDSIFLEDAIVEDEWGRTHASGVHVGGRIVLNIWRLMRGEVKLNIYTIEAVAEAVLKRKVPSIPNRILSQWFSSGPTGARFRCIECIIERANLDLEIMNKLDMVNRTSELARVFGIDFFSVLSRGSQYRVESMLLRLAHTQNYLVTSPSRQQVASQPAMECLPLVMEPESGFYSDPVVVLDFQSLYPSMIIAYNLCFCTCLGKVIPSRLNTLGVSSYSPDPQLLMDLKHQILLTPNGVMYVPSKVRKGILPRLLEEILSTRIMVKQAIKKLEPSQRVLHRIFNARQLALKLIANVTYGYTAAGFSGRMPCAELADSIVQCGRRTLETAISFVNSHDKWNARVIYGDTDSMFVLLKGRSVKESFRIGQEIASTITAMNPHPVTLKMEKVYHPCFLLTKKRYVGYSYESPDQTEPTFDAKGIETVRRDTCGAVAKTLEQSLRLFFQHQDILKVKAYLQRQWTRILCGKVSLQDFVFAKEVRLGTYSARASSLPPAAIVATKAMKADPRAEPRYAERIPYVVIHGEPGARLVDMVVDPMDILAIDSPFRLNDLYYINKQIIPALQRVFGLVGADLNRWFSEMPRPYGLILAKNHSYVPNPQRARIDYYYLSKRCILCGELVQASNNLCEPCSKKGPTVATAIVGRTSKLEREIQHLAAICQHCGGGDWIVESGVKCTSLACPVFYERQKVQKELKVLSAVANEAGFYPKCMVEWF
ncbi:PREDICTED: DNA polymerase zeta catalytic subunit [Nelumbo nucifera]|uniref:DNA polymerase n=1 Tax=Nelumbo nucifera TaxID=4432 RepID=A0A1U7YTB1_NELNU|nr:PREDICTED: DNA polymerase zeta catalytic subunit [Nelumbo nucifera]